MKCEICECDTYIIHMNAKHEKVCTKCYRKGAKDGGVAQTDNKANDKMF